MGSIQSSVLSPNVRVHQDGQVDHSVILSHTTIGRGAVIHRAILDKHVTVEEGAKVGVDPDADEDRGFYVSEGGITVVAEGRHGSGHMSAPASGLGGQEGGRPEGGTFGVDAPTVPAVLGAVALLLTVVGCVLMITHGFVAGLVTLIFALFFGLCALSYLYTNVREVRLVGPTCSTTPD